MENEIKKYLDENYPLNYSVMDKEEAQENYQTKLERIAFKEGVEWALKQVKNNGVLDDVSNCPNCGSTNRINVLCKDCGYDALDE